MTDYSPEAKALALAAVLLLALSTAPSAQTYPSTCPSEARAIVDAVGGCAEVDCSEFETICQKCCTTPGPTATTPSPTTKPPRPSITIIITTPTASASPTLEPTPHPSVSVNPVIRGVKCPTGCSCNNAMSVLECQGQSMSGRVTLSPGEAATLANARTGLTDVREVELREVGDTYDYRIRGTKLAWFLFVPLPMEVEANVDGKTGLVWGVEQPWWSFLTWG